MEIDMKLVKKILIWCKDNLTLNTRVRIAELEFKGYSSDLIKYNVIQLIEAGYIDSSGYVPNDYRSTAITKLSWQGHEYLNLLLSDPIGKKLMDFCEKMGIKPFPLILEFIKPFIVSQLGG